VSGETFPLPGRVRGSQRAANGQLRVAVSFEAVSNTLLQQLSDFVRTGVGEELPEVEPIG
jgi:hypothetical protein